MNIRMNGLEDNWVVDELAMMLGQGEEGLGKLRQELDQLAENEDEAARSTAKLADELDVRWPDEDGDLNKEELGKPSQRVHQSTMNEDEATTFTNKLDDELDEDEAKKSTQGQQLQRAVEAGKWPLNHSLEVEGGVDEELSRLTENGKTSAGVYWDTRGDSDNETLRLQRMELDQFIKNGKPFESEVPYYYTAPK